MANPSGASRTASAALFKTVYSSEKISDQFPSHTQFQQKIKRVAQEEGSTFRSFAGIEMPDSGRTNKEWGDLAKPRTAVHSQPEYNYATFDFTVRGSGQGEMSGGAVTRPLVRDLMLAPKAIALNYERQCFSERTGKLAGCKSASAATTLLVDSHRMLVQGMHVDVVVASSGAVSAGVLDSEITAAVPNRSNGEMTLTLSVGLATSGSINATYIVIPSGTYGKNPLGFPEWMMASNPTYGNIGGISRATAGNLYWQVYEQDASGALPDGNLLADVLLILNTQINETPTVIMANGHVVNDLIRQERTAVLRGPLTTMDHPMFGKRVALPSQEGPLIPIVGHPFMPFTDMWILNLNHWHIAHPPAMPADGMWLKRGPSGDILYPVPDKWGEQAAWVRMSQLICDKPGAQARIKNVGWALGGTA